MKVRVTPNYDMETLKQKGWSDASDTELKELVSGYEVDTDDGKFWVVDITEDYSKDKSCKYLVHTRPNSKMACRYEFVALEKDVITNGKSLRIRCDHILVPENCLLI